LGVAIVASPGDFEDGVQKAWDRRCNPGGEVRGERLQSIPPHSLPFPLTDRLLADRGEIEVAKRVVRAAAGATDR
jgi:hypothetical protein